MARKNNGRRARNGGTNGLNYLPYTDLVNSRIQTAISQADYTYSTRQLLPGLSFLAVGGRVFVPKRIDIEIIPQYLNATIAPPTTAVIQAQISDVWLGNISSEAFGSMKWKLISAVNPTKLSLSFDSLSRFVPFIKRPTSMVDNEPLLNLKIESGVAGQGIELFLVIKTLVRIMPQDALIGPEPTLSIPRRQLAAATAADSDIKSDRDRNMPGEPVKSQVDRETCPLVPSWKT